MTLTPHASRRGQPIGTASAAPRSSFAIGTPVARGKRATAAIQRQLHPLKTIVPAPGIYTDAVKAEEKEAAKVADRAEAASAVRWHVPAVATGMALLPNAKAADAVPAPHTRASRLSVIGAADSEASVVPGGSSSPTTGALPARKHPQRQSLRRGSEPAEGGAVESKDGATAPASVAAVRVTVSPTSPGHRLPLATPNAWNGESDGGLDGTSPFSPQE